MIHVGVRTAGSVRRPIPGSRAVPCDDCGSLVWIDPQCCAEIGGECTAHVCTDCAAIGPGDEIVTTVGALERALRCPVCGGLNPGDPSHARC